MEDEKIINPFDDSRLIELTQSYLHESQEAKNARNRINRENQDAYDNIQDFSDKIEGQSKEFVPKVSESVEQMKAFFKKALVQFGDWFSVDVGKSSILSAESVRRLLKCYLDNLQDGAETISFAQRLTDGLTTALLESVMVFKTHGARRKKHKIRFDEEGKKGKTTIEPWKLHIDLVRNQDYEVDPSGEGLYAIHTTERDLHIVKNMAKMGVYDEKVVNMISEDYTIPLDERKGREDDTHNKPQFRKKVVLREVWGTILDENGDVVQSDVFWTIANDKYVIRQPTPFPFWHGETPFNKIPLIRKPHSQWHKALYDQVVPLNRALNELFNLMLDGGLASVWGIKQLRAEYLEDPRQVSGGIPQGETLVISGDAPEGAKVLEEVSTGKIPPEALTMYSIMERETDAAALSNDIAQGLLPAKEVRATEVLEASQNRGVLLDAIVADVEREIERILQKAFMTILQNADDLDAGELSEHLTTRELFALARMSKKDRYNMLSGCKFKVFGLSQTLSKGRDFQRLMAILQVAQSSPVLMPVMMRRISGDKLWSRLLKLSNINPRDIEITEDDLQAKKFDNLVGLQMLQGQGGSAAAPTGEAGVQSEVHQLAKPSGGI